MLEIYAQLWRVVRDDEDATKLQFLCDSQQLDLVNKIPAQTLLKIKIEIEGN